MKEICWSFNALEKGFHPTHDSDGKPLQKGSPFYASKGKPLCSGYRAVLWNIQGDAEFFANQLGLAHWGSLSPCMECDAKSSTDDPSKYFKNIEQDKQDFKVVSNKEAAENPGSKHPLFHQLPGLTTKFVRGDALHILWCKGIYSHLLGSCLHYLVWHDGAGRQKMPAQERLGMLWTALQKAYQELGSQVRVTNLKLSMFADTKQPHASYPALNLKGGESKHFLPAFLRVCKAVLDPEIWHESCMLGAMESMKALVELFDSADVFLSQEEYSKATSLAKEFLDTYSVLNQWALEEGKYLFHIVYKFHAFQHLVANSCHLNPKACWCFANENYVARIGELVFSISPGVRNTKLSKKMAPKYRVLLHLLMTRDNFSLGERDPC